MDDIISFLHQAVCPRILFANKKMNAIKPKYVRILQIQIRICKLHISAH